jgi:hypothetical protein
MGLGTKTGRQAVGRNVTFQSVRNVKEFMSWVGYKKRQPTGARATEY